ncbi:hypothetical protein EDD18DRAFT_1363169 [Armillaria luteobubalina]|uniref:Uncharacterized protein n=1 Tax=Armillaria luteobubalina TaxID=153913 RepID=A0AA39PBM8_9AGAR|nr:hypothetical protein EDD18DRAFT_1363169 [Armillaria luteobubalina]
MSQFPSSHDDYTAVESPILLHPAVSALQAARDVASQRIQGPCTFYADDRCFGSPRGLLAQAYMDMVPSAA